jgi:hypothetical protein
VPESLVDDAEIAPRRREAGVELDGAGEAFVRVFVLVQMEQLRAQRRQVGRDVGTKANQRAIRVGALVMPVVHRVGGGEIPPGVGVIRLELHRALKLGDRLIMPLHRRQRRSEVVVRLRVGRIEPDRFATSLRRLLDARRRAQHFTKIVVIRRHGPAQGNRAADELFRLPMPPARQCDDAEQMQRVRLVRILRENALVNDLRLPQPPGGVVMAGDVQQFGDGMNDHELPGTKNDSGSLARSREGGGIVGTPGKAQSFGPFVIYSLAAPTGE